MSFFFLKGSSLVKEDIVGPNDVLIIDGYSLEGWGMIWTICSLVSEDIDDYMEELMIIGNDGMCFSL